MSQNHSSRRPESPKAEKIYDISDAAEMPAPKNILILEDDVALAILIKETLEMAGYGATIVSNGTEGLKRILTTDFNVILCDMVMPNFPGDMFFRAVERVRPQLCQRFIFMTGHKGDRKIEQFIRGVRGLMLWKPFEMQVLLEAVQAVNKKNQ